MNNNSRNFTTTTFRQESNTNATRPAKSHVQAPTPEPRMKLPQQHRPVRPISLSSGREVNIHGQDDNFNDVGHEAKLVIVKQHQQQHSRLSPPPSQLIYCETAKHTSFNEAPIELVTDEGVSSPTNVEFDDDEENPDEYYEDEDEYETSEQADELTNLSRQSMMPLHELIAYYQYIQHGSDQIQRIHSVSRQSSDTSQLTAKTIHSLNEDAIDGDPITDCVVIPDDSHEANNLEDLGEISFKKVQVPHVLVENVEDNEVCKDNQRQQGQPMPLVKDRRRIRANVVLELINSERDFAKHLRDVVEGYLYRARRHPEIFTGERINTIFSNIEQLYEFQQKFLDSLESCINWDDLAASEVGHCFLKYESDFSVYHHYCNNHPNAISELQDLYTKPRFVKFFEACRLLQNMIDISLDGFLLTPIQKICKYPLQLNELLKNTDSDHLDYHFVANALESMRNCANLANERKRRIEALADVMSFQEKVENWFGPKLSDTSSVLIHSGEVSNMTSHTWSQGLQLYLFDHLLLYFKKDLLKRNSLILKGRICMDTVTEISDGDEYKTKKSFKLFCSEQQKWFVFTTRSEKEKDEWIKAFERERNLVESDEIEGFHITEKEICVARRALQHRKHNRSARYRHKRPDTAIVDQLDIDDANTIMNRTLSLPSCIHPSHVMNFVEDSRIVSNRKKNSSPTSGSQSPYSSNQHLPESDGQQQQSTGSWFKKMGSKKLAKSQVYFVNGTGSTGGNSKHNPVSPTSLQRVDQSILAVSPSTSTTNYDQLEKRHRDHMVSEEQARLFRLNNDLPLPSFVTNKSSSVASQVNPARFSLNAQSQQTRVQLPAVTTSLREPSRTFDAISPASGINLCQDNDDHSKQDSSLLDMARSSDNESASTFETTIILSSGRVVRVREDAV